MDKFGRRWTLFLTDLVSWGGACLVWAIAQNVKYFIVAILLNGLYRLSHTAWTCLLVEDAEKQHLVHIWTWISIFAVCSAFFSPLGGWFVQRFGLIRAERGLLFFGCLVLTAKAIILFLFSHETERGRQRIVETRNESMFSLLADYRHVVKQVISSKQILAALSLMVITNIYSTVSGSFWGILFTSKLGFAESQISLYVMVRSVVMMVCFFVIGPRLRNLIHYHIPLWIGFGAYFISQALLVFMAPHMGWLLMISVLLEGLASSLVSPMTESMLAVAMESRERARVSAMVYVLLLILISPFGWIAGQLSAIDRSLPFALNMVLFAIGAMLVWIINRHKTSFVSSLEQME